MAILVLGAGIVGSAATWDLRRRGYDVVVADDDFERAERIATSYGSQPAHLDVADASELMRMFEAFDLVVSAVPYRFGFGVASAALATGTHYLDFGGNPSVVAAQKHLHGEAIESSVMIVPDCGLAPGLANVLAEGLIRSASEGVIDSIQMRVGALPQEPLGALGYQLAFNSAGLINEYAEPCEVIEDGLYATVEPLSRLEDVAWANWGPLEAFSTAGGTSTLCRSHEGNVRNLEYKTLRFPGHGRIFRAMLELGLFDESSHLVGNRQIEPRAVLIDSLQRSLPRDQPDIVLVRVWREHHGETTSLQIEDRAHGAFSALARTTAFPATALADLIASGRVHKPGVRAMHEAVETQDLMRELTSVGIIAVES
ncbi:MAG: saccharopine dehydrogenase NADP-binding domain-containing protein [Actinomycetia bacterium]|nr:saccharopine dehydrogenase NADP-binding domain-containing protein [Actinomycetes bacterium]